MKEIITRSELLSYVPFKAVNSLQYSYNRQSTLGTTNVVDPILPTGTWSESSPQYTTITDKLCLYADSAYVPRMGLRNPNIYGPLVQAKASVIARSFDKSVVSSSNAGTDPFWNSLNTQISGSTRERAVATIGSGSLALTHLDQLIQDVDAGPITFMVCNSATKIKILSLIRGSYSQPVYITAPNLGSGPVLLYSGVPVLVSDWMVAKSDSPATATRDRIFGVYANELDGVTGWYNTPSDLLVVDELGVNQSDLMEVQVKMRCGFSIQSTHAVAGITGIIA